jgi:hypothetical protein
MKRRQFFIGAAALTAIVPSVAFATPAPDRFDILSRIFMNTSNTKVTGEFIDLFVKEAGLPAPEDYVVVCDETNNTPARIAANELWVDVAIKPVNATEFTYIPVQIVNGMLVF